MDKKSIIKLLDESITKLDRKRSSAVNSTANEYSTKIYDTKRKLVDSIDKDTVVKIGKQQFKITKYNTEIQLVPISSEIDKLIKLKEETIKQIETESKEKIGRIENLKTTIILEGLSEDIKNEIREIFDTLK